MNSRYSQRAFARDLGISAGELSEILRGKRHLSRRSLLSVSRALNLNGAEARRLFDLLNISKMGSEHAVTDDSPSVNLAPEIFAVVSNWYCFALLNLMECENFKENAAWISKRLDISVLEADDALRRLQKVGLIERKNGRLIPVKGYVMSPNGIPLSAIRQFHHQILQKAQRALELQSIKERDISGITLALDPKDIMSIKKDIKEFLDSLIFKYSRRKSRKEVYHLESAFFRLTEGHRQ